MISSKEKMRLHWPKQEETKSQLACAVDCLCQKVAEIIALAPVINDSLPPAVTKDTQEAHLLTTGNCCEKIFQKKTI